MELPGSFSGKDNSPKPHLGPEARNRISLAIFITEQAITFNAPDTSTKASCAAKASNLLGAVINGKPVSVETFSATFSAKPILVFSPVPTAVPPAANMYRRGKVALILSMPDEKIR